MPHPARALVLLAALLGGVGAVSVHLVHHGLEWAASQAEHLAHGAHDDDADLVTTPCTGGAAHEAPCAVCTGFAGAVLTPGAAVAERAVEERERAAGEALAVYRRAATPARGPPAPAA
ncbi:hypothetical protein RQM47_04835 [Rubrivirga sp. S365]|uniref:DUF2946 domain-containing protein n=1 Tax=Rubrivirga litoralis TaxID=3075598 RepID=A0ABU3BQ03_9BACT|nr:MULTISPECIES: hypothetical protein [unclassified Rubrivirga]MDT0631367.1 hypothetical protein [Rubrivirga sp. F394]MDT7855958.1 hypothetical protein [Rubrivirga sp. S365]